jgi:Flp pilus assembly protein TadB
VNNVEERYRCAQCGQVDAPGRSLPGPAWVAIALWAGAAAVWALGATLAVPALFWVAAVIFLGALLYTLWLFFRRERACRHCGGRALEPA